MANMGGDRERLIRTFLDRNKKNRKPALESYKPQKQGTVASYKPSKRARY